MRAAQAAGAVGVQVGTLFALCEESGIAPALKRSLVAHAGRGEVAIRTDPRVSPTGYPFKIVTWPEDPSRGGARERICDLGYLRTAYARADGSVGYRCPGGRSTSRSRGWRRTRWVPGGWVRSRSPW